MLGFAGEVRQSIAIGEELDHLGRFERLLARADRLATTAARAPVLALLALLLLNVTLAVVFLAAGEVVFDDVAEFFRELMPGTWLSFAELLFVAAIAWAIHKRQASGEGWARYDNFWALSAGVFVVLAIDEITQATVFLADWLSDTADLAPAAGFRDLDAVLIVLLLALCGLVLIRRVGVLFRYPWAVALLAIAVVLGGFSQSLDSFQKSTSSEFALEESFKLLAEPFLIAGYLVVLSTVLRRSSTERHGD